MRFGAFVVALADSVYSESMRLPLSSIPPRWMATAAALGVAVAMSGCSTNEASLTMPVSGTFDYQLGGTYDSLPSSVGPSSSVDDPIDIVVRDAGAAPLTGRTLSATSTASRPNPTKRRFGATTTTSSSTTPKEAAASRHRRLGASRSSTDV